MRRHNLWPGHWVLGCAVCAMHARVRVARESQRPATCRGGGARKGGRKTHKTSEDVEAQHNKQYRVSMGQCAAHCAPGHLRARAA